MVQVTDWLSQFVSGGVGPYQSEPENCHLPSVEGHNLIGQYGQQRGV